MLIDTALIAVVLFSLWKWNRVGAGILVGLFAIVDIAYFSANMTKVPDGGWFPLLVGFVAFTALTTWARGRQLMINRMRESAMPVKVFVKSAASSPRGCPAPPCS
jgi:KUP system potassium uptake protein